MRAVRAAKRGNLEATCRPTQPLGRRLHPADADPDGGAVLLQRDRQAEGATTGGTATPCGSCSPPTSTTQPDPCIFWRHFTGSSTSRPTARFSSRSHFPFLIWQRRRGPFLLAAAIFLHLLFAFLMGLFYFSFVMIMGHMSFVRPIGWRVSALVEAHDRRHGNDLRRQCGFCVRSMAWFLAFDGLAQIRVRDFRTEPSPVVSDAQMEKALYLVLPDGRALPGFEAYRYVVLRVPGLWWHGAVLLRAGAQPPDRPPAIQLGRLASKPALLDVKPSRNRGRWTAGTVTAGTARIVTAGNQPKAAVTSPAISNRSSSGWFDSRNMLSGRSR